MPKPLVPIIMGSKDDLKHAELIGEQLANQWGIPSRYRVASAHKHPEYTLKLLREYDKSTEFDIVYVTVAGRSDALSGVVSANTTKPVIACPPYSDKFGGADIYSSLRMPSRASATVSLEPKNAADAVAKIFALSRKDLSRKVERYLSETKKGIEKADKEVSGDW